MQEVKLSKGAGSPVPSGGLDIMPWEAAPGEGTFSDVSLELAGSAKPGGEEVVVHVVSQEGELLSRHAACVPSQAPPPGRVYELDVNARSGAKKKISFENPHMSEQLFHLTTDQPSLLRLTPASVRVPSLSGQPLGLHFVSSPALQGGGRELDKPQPTTHTHLQDVVGPCGRRFGQ